jgi:flagellar motor component MotA
MLITCTHCQANLDITSDLYGQVVQCPICNGKLQIAAPAASAAETLPTGAAKPERHGWKESDHANVDFLKACLIGTGLTVVWLVCMIPEPIRGTIGAIFLDRGWVDYMETWFFFWGLTILYFKWVKIQHQEKATLLNLFPSNLGDEVNSSTVGAFIDNIYDMPAVMRDSIIVNRIRKALELFEIRNSKSEVEALLNSASTVDANRSTGSYSLVKVFLWAIPILGFIGTVLGLSQAVGSLSIDTSDPEALKGAISNLTGGLGVAFDTTLLGLVLSMILSFPLAAVQKKEDETLTLIDAFCSEKLLPRLNDSYLDQAIKEETALLLQAENLPEMVNSLSKAHGTFLENLNLTTSQLRDTGASLRSLLSDNQSAATQIHLRMAQSFDSANQQLLETQKTLAHSFTQATDRLSKSATQLIAQSEGELNANLKRLANGIESFNANLKAIGVPAQGGRKGFLGLFGN